MPTSTDVNLLPLGLCSKLLVIDWFFTHRTKVYCYEKSIESLNDDGERILL